MDREDTTVSLSSLSAQEGYLARKALKDILDSAHFRKSKRYPSLLEFVVKNALDGNLSVLKERTLGVEVFGRPADYDAATDPAVRIAIREVRRRLAEYYNEHPESAVQIDLPVGSYVPEFRFHSVAADSTDQDAQNEHKAAEVNSTVEASKAASSRSHQRSYKWLAAGLATSVPS